MLSLPDALGWIGGGLGATAYVLVSRKRIAPESVTFQSLNMIGAVLLGYCAMTRGALPSAVMNFGYVGFGAFAIVTAARRWVRAVEHAEVIEILDLVEEDLLAPRELAGLAA